MFSVQTPALHGWHRGEVQIQNKLHFTPYVSDAYAMIASSLPPQHRMFHSNNIAFFPVASVDKDGSVWCSILCGDEGKPGFIFSPDDKTLIVLGNTWVGEPTRENWKKLDQETLVAGVGVELESRRRNKLAGKVKRAVWSPDQVKVGIEIEITQAIGNCPKYITVRHLAPYLSASPSISLSSLSLSPSDSLPPQILSHISQADTIFLATAFSPLPSEAFTHPPHLGCNHRGGPKGFLRISPANSRKIYLPDLSGNRLMTSLGNIETNPSVGICIPDFTTGDILYLTGNAKNYVGEEAGMIMKRVKCVTEIEILGYTLVKDALPFRHSDDEGKEEKSPYTPAVRYLVEEESDVDSKEGKARVGKSEKVSDGLMRITFEIEGEEERKWKAGQYVVLDTTSIIGEHTYAHMSQGDEKYVNEDGVRTWTISSPPPTQNSSRTTTPLKPTFSITIRHIPSGHATSRLFHLLSTSSTPPRITLPLLGIGGSFLLPSDSSTPILAVAGGIGITPFLAFLGELKRREEGGKVRLIVASREPEVVWRLIGDALSSEEEGDGKEGKRLIIDVDLFDTSSDNNATHQCPALPPIPSSSNMLVSSQRLIVTPYYHTGRIPPSFWQDLKETNKVAKGTRAYICGPQNFEVDVLKGLKVVGIGEGEVEREKFDY